MTKRRRCAGLLIVVATIAVVSGCKELPRIAPPSLGAADHPTAFALVVDRRASSPR